MEIWNILGIEKTQDKEAIQKAYREKLLETHPEEDPQGFMRLRSALEAALREAEEPKEQLQETEKWSDDAMGQWMKKVDQLYRHFSRRIDVQEWKKLLAEDLCLNLDSGIEVRNNLLHYMMEHFFLPQSVMKCFDEEFGLMENIEELKELFPPVFLEYVIVQGIQKAEYPPYASLRGEDGQDFDGYLRLSANLSRSIADGETQNSLEIIERMQQMEIENPYLQIEYARVLCQEERYEEAKFEMEELLKEFEDFNDAKLMYADTCGFLDDYETAKIYYQQVLNEEPDHEWARCGIARCLMKEGKYKEANELFSDILEANPYDFDTAEWLKECNELYIAELKDKMQTCEDEDAALDLAWCYYQNEQYEDAILLLERMEVKEEHRIEQKSTLSRCMIYAEKYEEAIKYLNEWRQLLLQLPETEENKEKQKKQLPFCLLLQSQSFSAMGNLQKALECAEEAKKMDECDPEIFVQMGMIFSKQWRMEEAVESFTKAIKLNPENHAMYVMRARAYFYMGHLSAAYDDCEKTIEIFPYELSAFVFKIKTLIEAGELDGASEVLQYLHDEMLEGSELDFLQGYLLEARGEIDEAKKIYESIVRNYKKAKKAENVFNVNNLAEVYHHLATIQYHSLGATYESVTKLVDKGIQEDSDYIQLQEMKAELAHECRRYKEALKLYEKIAERAPGRIGIYGAMDTLYRELDEWEKALECAEKQLEQATSGYSYMRRGQLLAYFNRNSEARDDFRRAISLAPELAYPYNYMGMLEELAGKEDSALEYYRKAIHVGEQEEELCEEAYLHAAQLLCRKKEFTEAMDLLEIGYEIDHDDEFLQEQLYVLRRVGAFEEAEELLDFYKKVHRLKSLSPEYLLQLGHILRDQGDEKGAFDVYDFAGTKDRIACLEAGKNLFYRGKFKKALKYFKESFAFFEEERDDDYPEFLLAEHYLWAARAAVALKDNRLAESLAREGLQYIPENYEEYESSLPMIEKMLGGLHAILGNYEEAERYLHSAMDRRKCDICHYGACMDSVIEQVYLYWICGNRDKLEEALELAGEINSLDADIRGLKKLIR